MAAKRPFRLTHSVVPEAAVLEAVLQLLAVHPLCCWAARMNSGAGKITYASGATSQFMRWGFPGCPDVIGQLRGGRVLLMEIKSATGRVRPEQQAFLEKAIAAGACGGIVRNVDDALALLNKGATC
jgi:hypothetical protein